jgi:AcrR family transcriptional regulator
MISRARILEAAARVYAKHGFRGATTRLIAIEAGVNEVTLFRTFGSKGALLEAVLTHNDEQFAIPKLPEVPVDPEAELTSWIGFAIDKLEGRHYAHDELRAYVERVQAAGLASQDIDVLTSVVMLVSAVMGDVMGRPMVPDVYPPADEAASRYVRCFVGMIGAHGRAAAVKKSRSRIA